MPAPTIVKSSFMGPGLICSNARKIAG